MTFDTPNGLERPVRLSEATRQFAYESLHHKYGLDTRRTDAVSLDDLPGFDAMTPLEQYDAAIARIAAAAPIRLCPDERLSGAATLGAAIRHVVPATYRGQFLFGSISHLTPDFAGVLKYGAEGLRRQALAALERYAGQEQEPFVRSCLHCLDAFALWHSRYREALKDRPEYAANAQNLQNVPMKPAATFAEAVQSLWFTFAFVRLCGNWPGIGRIDWLLGDYLEADLQAERLTREEAREILAHFFIKGCEWISGGDYVSGDAQHYQNILLAGVDENGREVTNTVTYLVLDILEELGISDFPTTVRLNKHTDERLLRRVAEVMRYGGGTLAVYDEDQVIEAMTGYGYSLCEARRFANDGCWEVQVPGATYFTYMPFDSLAILQQKTLKGYAEPVDFPDFESLYRRYIQDLNDTLNEVARPFQERCRPTGPAGEGRWTPEIPCTVVSLFEQGCLENGRSYLEGGPRYNVASPHIGGLADTVNSLYAIRKLVYDEKKLSLPRLLAILRNNWEGEEPLRQYVRTRYTYYGNGQEEADGLAARLLHDFADGCDRLNGPCGYRFPAGVSTFGRQLEWASHRLATAYGRRAGEVLAANASPTPGTDQNGATAIIRSYCRADLRRMVTGAALDIKLLPSCTAGEDGLQALMGLMRGFVALGGCFMQLDVVDAAVLREAQAHPEEYSTLSVRVSGWNARFVTLSREWQDMVIAQNEQGGNPA